MKGSLRASTWSFTYSRKRRKSTGMGKREGENTAREEKHSKGGQGERERGMRKRLNHRYVRISVVTLIIVMKKKKWSMFSDNLLTFSLSLSSWRGRKTMGFFCWFTSLIFSDSPVTADSSGPRYCEYSSRIWATSRRSLQMFCMWIVFVNSCFFFEPEVKKERNYKAKEERRRDRNNEETQIGQKQGYYHHAHSSSPLVAPPSQPAPYCT